MDFRLTKEQEMIKKEARYFLERECPEELVREAEKSTKAYSPSLWGKIAELGWLGIIFPEKYGGMDGTIIDLVCICEEMGRAMFPGPYLSTVLCGLMVLEAGTEAQKSELLRRLTKGDLIMALALTEPDAAWGNSAWDAGGITVSAVADGDGYLIRGTKLFVHDALIAEKLLCVTRTRESNSPEQDISLFLVDAVAPGLHRTPLITTGGDKQCEVVFDSVRVPKRSMVGQIHGGWEHIVKAIQYGAVLICAQMVGAGERILQLAVRHAKSRVQFDAPIGINQYIQGYCTDLLADVEGSRFVTYQAAWKLSEKSPAEYAVAVAKAWTNEAIERACHSAHSVFAGYGYTTKDGPLPMYTRRSKVQQLCFGTSDYWLEKVALELENWTFDRPRGKTLGLWGKPVYEQAPGWEVWTKEDSMEV